METKYEEIHNMSTILVQTEISEQLLNLSLCLYRQSWSPED